MHRWVALGLVGLLALSAGCAGVGPAPSGPVEDGPGSAGGDIPAERVHTVTVETVVDGDTMDVRYENGSSETIRLLGVDTPEVHTETAPAEFEGIPETTDGREWLRAWGHRASEFARTELAGAEVRIVVDAESDVRGSYGRLLVYVYQDDELFNRQLLEQGYARMFDSQFAKRQAFSDAEADAQSGGVGLWGYGEGTAAGGGGSTAGDTGLVVAEIHADAEGNDHENLNDEYVVLENTGNESLEMGGWRVSDEADHTYVVPEGFSLPPGERVRLHTGAGTDTDTELYWHRDSAIWNNAGDTVVVSDADGDEVLSKTYD